MYSFEQDLTYGQSTVHELEEYLLSNVLYWPMTARGGKHLAAGMTQLTIGNLLLSIRRLETAGAKLGEMISEVTVLRHLVEQVREQWKSNWDKKAGAEIRSRLTQWDHYLAEMAGQQGGSHGDYPYNIRQRVILELLLAEIDKPLSKEQTYLAALDQRIRSSTHPSGFLWDETLQAGFPEQPFWFLYRKPA